MDLLALSAGVIKVLSVLKRDTFTRYVTLTREFGFIVGLGVSFLRPNVAVQYERVEELVLNGDDQRALEFRQAVANECNMTAIAGAIIAQVAVTGLSLPNLSATHWLARACLLFAVISGCLSVYYSCVLQRIIGQLYSPALVREWLRLSSKDDWETASLAAIFTLSAPFELMGVSIFSFLLGLAVYQGFTWIYSLDTAAGPHDSRNVFIFFIVGTGFCGIFFSSTFTLKFAENLLRQDQRPRARSSAPFNSDPVAEHDRSRHTGGQMMESRQNRFARISEDETLPAKELSAVLEAAAQAQIQCAEANQALALAYLRASRSQQETTQGTAQECRI